MSTQEKPKATYYYKLFRVKRKDGRVTTVSMDPILVTRACQVMGGLRTVSKLVRDVAFSYEDGMYKNCSGYVAEQLRQAMVKASAERAAQKAAAAAMLAAA
jgi:hypothetical protein